MTGNELRQHIADIMTMWTGGAKGGAQHKEIITLYNSILPHPRGHALLEKDDYCAATVSAAAVKAGIAEYFIFECSCNELIKQAQTKGWWCENDAYAARIGDLILYAWSDTGVGDCTLWANHIGMITGVNGESYTVTEGNMTADGRIGTRVMKRDGRYIRGYIAPDYDVIARTISPKEDTEMSGEEICKKLTEYLASQPLPAWAEKEFAEAKAAGITDGSSPMQFIPRYQAAIMAARALNSGNIEQ